MDKTTGTWIEASKELPKERDWYLGVFQEADTGWINPLPFICDYVGQVTLFTTKEGWILHNCTDNIDTYNCTDNIDTYTDNYYKELKCVAWMPLPEPYCD